MNWANVGTVYLKELKDALRDRRTLMSTIIIPLVAMPLMTFGLGRVMSGVVKKVQEEIPSVALVGGEDSPGVVAAFRKSARVRLVPTPADWRQAIGDKKLRVAVEIPPGFEAGLKASAAPPLKIFNYAGEPKSENGARVVERFLADLRDQSIAERLAERALPKTLARPFEIRRENVAPPEKVGGNLLGGVVPYMIIILCFTGAMYPAIDLTAGEKERGTLETLLCSPASRLEIVLGKFFLVLTGSLSAMGLSLLSMGLTAAGTGLMFASGPRNIATGPAGALPLIDPLGLLGVLAMVVPVAVLFSALQLAVALFARTSKEAQTYLGPMIFVVLAPAIIGLLPGIDLNARLALVPLLNLSLVCKEMLSGVWHWGYIALIFGSSCLYAAAALGLAVRMFSREEVLFRA
jgi:sodium transport system permease protein